MNSPGLSSSNQPDLSGPPALNGQPHFGGQSSFAGQPSVNVDLSPLGLARLFFEHWRENLLCRRVWRMIRAYVWALMAFQLVLSGFAVALQLVSAGITGAPGNLPGFLQISLTLVMGFAGVLIMGLLAAMPIFFASWAYRKTYLEDEMLRSSAMPRRDRLMGMLIPAILGIFMYFIPAALFTPVISYLSLEVLARQLHGFGGMGALPRSLMVLNQTFSQVAIFFCYSMLFSAIFLRRLIQSPKIGAFPGKNPFFVAVPYLVAIAVYIGYSFLKSGPYVVASMMAVMKMMAAGAPPKGGPPPMPDFSQVSDNFWIASHLLGVIADLAAVMVMFFLMRRLWRRDLPEAKVCLFDAPGPAWAGASFDVLYVRYPDLNLFGPYSWRDAAKWGREGRLPPQAVFLDAATGLERPYSEFPIAWPDKRGRFAESILPRNIKAIVAYYLGVFAFLGLLLCLAPGIIAGIVAIVYGVKGLNQFKRDPGIGGRKHAITGIVLGSINIILGLGAVVWIFTH